MAAMSAALRLHSRVGCPARANWMASAVPHEPAPSTATGSCDSSLSGALTAKFSWRARRAGSVRRALDLGLLLRNAARVHLVEVDRRQHEVREAALRHQLRHGHARVREQHVRADGCLL